MEPPAEVHPPRRGAPEDTERRFGESAEPQNIDQSRLYSILDNLSVSMGLRLEAARTKYTGIINSMSMLAMDSETSIAASELAARPVAWQAWLDAVGLVQAFGSLPDVTSETESIKSTIKYPLALRTLENVDSREPNMLEFMNAMKFWATNDPSIQWDQTSEVPCLWEPLLLSWSCSRHAVANSRNEANQRNQRLLVDSMIQLIFFQSTRTPEEYCEVMLETEVALPRPSVQIIAALSATKAGAIVAKEVPSNCRQALDKKFLSQRLNSPWALQFLYRPLLTFYVGVFPMESKRSSNDSVEVRVVLDLCSIQYQRRVLGLESRPVYGATCSRGNFQLYASQWMEGQLVWSRVDSCAWDLSSAAQFIQCLYFLWALKKHLDKTFKDDFDKFDAVVVCNNLRQGTWRFPLADSEPREGRSQSSLQEGDRADNEIGAENVLMGDEDENTPRAPRSLTLQDVIKNLPLICEQLLKFDQIERWKKDIAASSDHEETKDVVMRE